MSLRQKRTKQGFEMNFGFNYLGHFYLTFLLMKKLWKSDFFRILNLSSVKHLRNGLKIIGPNFLDPNFKTTEFNGHLAYSQSKLYINLFTHALASKIPEDKGIVMSYCPGNGYFSLRE